MIITFQKSPSPRRHTNPLAVEAKAVLAKHGKTFAFASRFLSPSHRTRATTLYAFCRQVDDLADNADNCAVAGERLSRLREDIAAGEARDGIAAPMLSLMADTGMPKEPVLALIDGVMGDLGTVRFRSERQLLRYSYRVAGSVGIMMCYVLDAAGTAAFRHAVDLGIAMQLTNIARDVAEDAANGRIYLPAEWTGDLGPDDIINPGPGAQEALRAAVSRTLALAEQYYDSGLKGLCYLPSTARFGIYLAAQLYRAIGLRIAANHFQSWQFRAHLTAADKLRHGLRLALTRPDFRSPAAHRAQLHRHLQGLFGVNGEAAHG